MSILEDTLVEITQILHDNSIPYMIIGGMANAVWGKPRSTLDIDITVWISQKETETVISLLSNQYRPLISDPMGFINDTSVLPLESRKANVRIDLIFGKLPYEKDAIDRAVDITVSGTPIRFCTPEDLILHKIISSRKKDMDDAFHVALRQMEKLDLTYIEPRIKELSTALEQPEIWETWEKWKKAEK